TCLVSPSARSRVACTAPKSCCGASCGRWENRMLDNWEALIPFYVAGTLSREETAHLEKVLAHNAEARRSLEEWRGIAAAVRADAARQLRDLPPLSAQVIAQANAQAADRRYFQPQIAASERSAAPVVKRRAAPLSITMLAAVFTVVIFGGLLAFMVLRGIDPRQQGAPAVV